MFNKILIANRGEIAVRIIRACREMNIATVAVYSESDRQALHVRLADEAVGLGPALASESYLNISKIIQAAQATGAQAIHPGYGFLSENAAFAQAVQEAGITFIGPSPQAIQDMGDKGRARQLMQKAGVPVIAGYEEQDDEASLLEASKEIGYPLIVKAAAGGGGKGMRVVWSENDLSEGIGAARREALRSFGDQRLIVERYIPNAHHVEIQILADHFENVLHLFERECSVQRRHQKIIEESPSPLIDDDLRMEMGAAAVSAAQAVAYRNAGTVEFIVDPQQRSFYFLEMNTRLQVEHPVTEMVTGLDIVHWQIRIAADQPLDLTQDQIKQHGHAIECRLYAEDPENNFLPATGKLLRFIEPKGPGVRVDSGVTSGDNITIHYDPMIAKIITHAEDRESAIHRMQATLRETVLLGLTTNWQFLQDVLSEWDFHAGKVYTTWVEEHFGDWQAPKCELPVEVLLAAALTQYSSAAPTSFEDQAASGRDPYTPWRVANGFRLGES